MKKSHGCIKLVPNKACEIVSVINSEAVQLNFSQNILFHMTKEKSGVFCIKMFLIQIFLSACGKNKCWHNYFSFKMNSKLCSSESNPLFANMGPLTVYIVAYCYLSVDTN